MALTRCNIALPSATNVQPAPAAGLAPQGTRRGAGQGATPRPPGAGTARAARSPASAPAPPAPGRLPPPAWGCSASLCRSPGLEGKRKRWQVRVFPGLRVGRATPTSKCMGPHASPVCRCHSCRRFEHVMYDAHCHRGCDVSLGISAAAQQSLPANPTSIQIAKQRASHFGLLCNGSSHCLQIGNGHKGGRDAGLARQKVLEECKRAAVCGHGREHTDGWGQLARP